MRVVLKVRLEHGGRIEELCREAAGELWGMAALVDSRMRFRADLRVVARGQQGLRRVRLRCRQQYRLVLRSTIQGSGFRV